MYYCSIMNGAVDYMKQFKTGELDGGGKPFCKT